MEAQDPSLDEITAAVYGELRRLAAGYLSGGQGSLTLQPTALVQEAYLRMAGQDRLAWQNRGHFFGIAARCMRHMSLGQTGVAREYYRKAAPLEETAYAEGGNAMAAGDYGAFLVKSASLEGPAEESLATLRRAVGILDALAPRAGGVHDLRRATARTFIAHRLTALGRLVEAIAEYCRATALMDAMLASGSGGWEARQRRLEAIRGRARAHRLSGDRERALEAAREPLREAGESGGRAPAPSLRGSWPAEARLVLASAHRASGECGPAAEAAREAVRIAQPLATGGAWDPNGAIVKESRTLLMDVKNPGAADPFGPPISYPRVARGESRGRHSDGRVPNDWIKVKLNW
jgi:hypothetical protein